MFDFISLCLILLLSLPVVCAQINNEKYGKPEIILYEHNPWLMVIGSDTPVFALYESGIVIYKDVETGQHFSVQLTEGETTELKNHLGINDALLGLDEYYDVSNWTDQPSNELILNFDSSKTINVYGSIRDSEEDRENTPASFLKTFDKIISYRNEKAREWMPDKIEVMVWEYENAPDKPVEWKEEWEDLNSPDTIDRGGVYSIYLDNKYYEELLAFIKNLGPQQPVRINGKKFTIALRLPFPNI